MSGKLTQLFPSNEQHSVAEVVVTFNLGKKIDNPQDFVNRFKTLFTDFQQVGITFTQGIQVQIDTTYTPKINSNDPEIEGFFARKLNENSTQNIVIQNYIHLPSGIPHLSFHFLNYTRYNDFLSAFFNILNRLSTLEAFIVKAIGLTYVDLFDWRSQENLPLDKIFRKKNEYLSERFFSYVGNFMISHNGIVKRDNEQEYIEKINIRAVRKSELSLDLQIVHDVILDLKKSVFLNELLESQMPSLLKDTLDYEHQLNKEFLNNILSQKVKNKIKLTI